MTTQCSFCCRFRLPCCRRCVFSSAATNRKVDEVVPEMVSQLTDILRRDMERAIVLNLQREAEDIVERTLSQNPNTASPPSRNPHIGHFVVRILYSCVSNLMRPQVDTSDPAAPQTTIWTRFVSRLGSYFTGTVPLVHAPDDEHHTSEPQMPQSGDQRLVESDSDDSFYTIGSITYLDDIEEGYDSSLDSLDLT